MAQGLNTSFVQELAASGFAGAKLTLPQMRRPKVACVGSSSIASALSTGPTIISWTSYSFIPWVKWAMRDRLRMDVNDVYGVGGSTSADLQRQVRLAIASRVDLILMYVVNDIGDGLTTDQTIANVRAVIGEANDAGIFVLLISPFPQANWDAGAMQKAVAMRRRFADMAVGNPQMTICDIAPQMIDPATGKVLATYMRDDFHTSKRGAQIAAQPIIAALDRIVGYAPDLLTDRNGDTYDAVNNPGGNMLLNGLMAGTGGVRANPGTSPVTVTGDVATSWRLGNASATPSTMTIAASKAAHPDLPQLPVQRVTLGGIYNNVIGWANQQIALPAGVSPGDTVYAEGEVFWQNMVGLDTLRLRTQITQVTAGVTTTHERNDGTSAADTGLMPAAGRGLFRSPTFVLPADITAVNFLWEFRGLSGEAISGTFDLGRCAFRKVV